MPAKVKFEQVSALRAKLEITSAIFVAEYRGMTVEQSTALRVKIRGAGGELKVAKNTLFAIAMKEAGLAPLPDSMTTGPNAYAICHGDPVSVAKVLKECNADKTLKGFVLKGGLLGSSVLNTEQVLSLAELPPKEVMIAQVVRTIAAPISGLVTVLSGTIRGLVTCLDQIREQKEKAA